MKRLVNHRGLFGLMALVLCLAGQTLWGQGNSHKGQPAKKLIPHSYTITIAGMKFNPAQITVHKGDKVTFVNQDLVTHDVTEASKKIWTSSPLAVDKSWSLTVTQSATYYCSIHPIMKGKIIVK